MAAVKTIKNLVRPYVPKRVYAYIRRKRRVGELEELFREGSDPWNFASSSIESERFSMELDLIRDRRYASALEIGCAEGMFTEKLAEVCDHVLAVDCSETAVARANERLRSRPHVNAVCRNIRRWENGRQYELVTANEVLYYVDDQCSPRQFHRFLAKMAGYVRPGGRLLMTNVLEIESPDGSVCRWDGRRRYVEGLAECGLSILKEFDVCQKGPEGKVLRSVALYERRSGQETAE